MDICDDGELVRPLDQQALSPARRYNYLLGGKDNFAVDRASGDRIAAAWPAVRDAAREHRNVVRRMVAYAVEQYEIRQIIDVGCGLPDPPDVHYVAQAVDPTCRVAYVDNDPMVLVHARGVHAGHPAGRIDVIPADARYPRSILDHPHTATMFDRREPILLLLCGILHHLPDDQATLSLQTLTGRLSPASLVAVTHPSLDLLPTGVRDRLQDELADPSQGHEPVWWRTRAHLQDLVDDLDLDPVASAPAGGAALVSTVQWHPRRSPIPGLGDPAESGCFAWMGARR